jgi:peptidyl-prolyl cis-trans isomerase A (cyclophilin A)
MRALSPAVSGESVVLPDRTARLFLAFCFALLAGCGAGGNDPSAEFAQRLETAASAASSTSASAAQSGLPVLLPRAAAAAAPPSGPAPQATPVITNDQFFQWAESVYPQFFPAGGQPGELQTYRFRYYPSTDLYLAIQGSTRVVVLGRATGYQLVDLGAYADFAPVVAAAVAPVVSDIQPSRLSYLQTTTFRITGVRLDANLTVNTRRCTGLAAQPGGSATEQNITCTITATGTDAVGFELRDVAGNVVASRSYNVPDPQVTMATSLGTIVVELNPTVAPVTTDNFLRYVQARFYDNTIFHRVVGGFVAQGGWLTPAPAEQVGRRDPIALESNRGLSNLRGTIAMARTSEPNSATSQFYFNLVDNTTLDYASAASPGYAVFGRIVQGLSVMDAIGAVPTATRFGLANFPLSNVVVQGAIQTR